MAWVKYRIVTSDGRVSGRDRSDANDGWNQPKWTRRWRRWPMSSEDWGRDFSANEEESA